MATTNNKIRGLLAVALAAAMGGAQAAQDLLTTYQQALRDDPQLAAAAARRRADDEKLAQARSLFLPSVGVQGDYYRVRQELGYGSVSNEQLAALLQDSESSYNTYSYGIQLTQPLFRKESFTLYKQAGIIVDQAELNYAIARQDLTLRVAESYFAVLQAENVVQSYDAELAAIEQQLARAKRAFELGAGTITDVNDAQARYDLTVARRLQALNDVRIAREALRRITGSPVGELAPLADGFAPPTPEPADAAAWAERAQQRNLQVLLAESALRLARDEIERQRAQHYPKVDLIARYGRQHQELSMFQTEQTADQAQVGVTLTMPLYTGGAISSQIREAVANKDQALEQVRAARRGAALAAEQAYLSLDANLQQMRALEQALKSIRLNEESTRRGQELGLRTTLDVLNVQRERYAAERDLANARYGYLLNYLRLRAAVGDAVEEQAIEAVNQFLARTP